MAEDDGNGTYYVWSPIKYHALGEMEDTPSGAKHQSSELKTLKPGARISRDHEAVADDDTWDAWREGGVVRKTPWPKGLNPDNPNGLSPNAHRMSVLRKQRERMEAEMEGVGGEYAPGGNKGEDTVSTPEHAG